MLVLLAALAAAAAAGLLYYLLRKKKTDADNDEDESPGHPGEDSSAQAQRGQSSGEDRRENVRQRTTASMDEIVNRLKFASGRVTKRMKVGEDLVPSPIPTGELAIRAINTVAELPKVLPRALAMDDDMFFSGLAGHQLPVVEYQERVDVIEDVAGVPRKVLVLIVDVSGSMREYGRAAWAIGLCRKLILKAQTEGAEVALLPFTDALKKWRFARSGNEWDQLAGNLETILRPDGGTDVDLALSAGIKFLQDDSFTERKILLLTDGESNINPGRMQTALRNVGAELSTVCIGPNNPDLKFISNRYDLLAD